MPFDAQNYEYLKNDFHLKRELIADSRDKIIRHSNIKKKFQKPIGFLLISNPFLLSSSNGDNYPNDFNVMKWKQVLLATLLIYILGIDEWIMYYASYADYCYKVEKFYNNPVKPKQYYLVF